MSYEFQSHGIFPTPVIKSNINREWTKEEKKFFKYHSEKTHDNMGNTTSQDHYVLKSEKASGLLDFINKAIQYYVDTVICPNNRNDVDFYVTQSWLNYTKEGQYHHKHAHPNSIISGVLYIDADVTLDKILFFNDSYKQIKFHTDNYNWYNSESWFFEVKTGDLVLFPSSLTHMVETKRGENVRSSLAFNVFAKGFIGDEHQLTALHVTPQDPPKHLLAKYE